MVNKIKASHILVEKMQKAGGKIILPEKKEDVKQCNCGLIVSDDVSDYSVVIRNGCSGNQKKFYLQAGDWMTAYVGSNYCLSNVSSW